jgi:hypothetical protein
LNIKKQLQKPILRMIILTTPRTLPNLILLNIRLRVKPDNLPPAILRKRVLDMTNRQIRVRQRAEVLLQRLGRLIDAHVRNERYRHDIRRVELADEGAGLRRDVDFL